jgi:hypothetical protein
MDDEFFVICPYCGEEGTIYIEPDVRGSLVQDCEVCCNPWLIRIMRDGEERVVDVSRADGSE